MARRSAIPKNMRKVSGRFARWRKSHPGRSPIPDRLWAAAAELAKEHGIGRTAQVLRLEYGKLRRLAESTGPVKRVTTSRTPRASFVELVTPQAVGPLECLIELEGPRGKMRIQWKGTSWPDLSGMSRTLWESA
jgi:hypothetical protein